MTSDNTADTAVGEHKAPATAGVDIAARGLGSDDFKELSLRLAHSIRNPLATIMSGVQLVKRLEMDPTAAAPYLDSVVHEVGRISDTLAVMEEYVRLAAREAQSVFVYPLLAALAANLDAIPAPLTLSCDEVTAVRIDPGHLQLALQNLISNAGRFAPHGTSIEAGASRRGDGWVAVWVQDAGPGIPSALAQRIMRPFFSTSTQGFGLGLNRVQKICRMAGGRLEWCNLESGGCRFTMLLPEG